MLPHGPFLAVAFTAGEAHKEKGHQKEGYEEEEGLGLAQDSCLFLGLCHEDPRLYRIGPPAVASLTRSDGRARERQARRLLPAPACVCSARRGCHSLWRVDPSGLTRGVNP